MNFKKINTITGWVIFTIASLVYLFTMQRTVSFWDCGEFLATAYKLEVGHSPGAPLYMLMGRIFALFAPDKESVALLINSMSAFASSFTVLFLFWTITHFARKIMAKEETDRLSSTQILSIMGAGIVGALAYTFSDTFWFSAVEAEVYATSSFFTAVTFWSILKWEHVADTDPYADRWLVLIFFLIGLSVGVHLLNLLTIPSVILIYYLRRYKNPSLIGGIVAFIVGGIILGIVQFGIIQFLSILAAKFELFFTNSLGMPFNSGTIIFLLIIAALVYLILSFAKRTGRYLLHLATICFVFTLFGFASPYAITVIRSKADVPIDMVNPDNVVSLIPYLQREQYGSQPIFKGNNFDATLEKLEDGDPNYAAVKSDGKDKYEIVGYKQDPTFAPSVLFPRMWDFNKADLYYNTLGKVKGDPITYGDNLKYFFGHQLNWMYWRYFMWNYSGRQNDYQGQGEAKNGNWISGIKFIDKLLGKGDIDLASDSYKNNRARNQYYMLPFILGIIGLLYQYKKDKSDTGVVTSLFIMTGLAIVVYLNNTPMQPRERDYAYISTYPFAIWIGLGVLQITEWLSRYTKDKVPALIATGLSLLAVPVLMAQQNWDDHTRAHSTLARDHAFNMLMSCDSNAILIVNGDNDTYPLWYLQEIEGVRTDVRILNSNLLNTDWQNEQMFYKVNDADATPMIWTKQDVMGDRLESVPVVEDPRLDKNQYYAASDIIKFLMDRKNDRQFQGSQGKPIPYVPTRKITVVVDPAVVQQSGLIKGIDSSAILSEMRVDLGQRSLMKGDLCVINMVAANAAQGWKRPIYFAAATPAGGFEPYLVQEGLLNKLVPIQQNFPANSGVESFTGVEKNIHLIQDVFKLGNANTNKPHYDEKHKNSIHQYRVMAYSFANYLIAMGKKQEAINILNRVLGMTSETSYPNIITVYDKTILGLSDAYYRAGDKASARKYIGKMISAIEKDTDYYVNLKESSKDGYMQYLQQQYLAAVYTASQIATVNGDLEMGNKWKQMFDQLTNKSSMQQYFRDQLSPPAPQQPQTLLQAQPVPAQ